MSVYRTTGPLVCLKRGSIEIFSSNNFALKGKRKTITATDVLSALEDMEFDQFVDPLKECLAGKTLS